MKRFLGNFIERLLSGGATLTDVEFDLLQHLVGSLPPSLRSIVEIQFGAYNRVYREIDGRALNFYRLKRGKAADMEGLPLLDMAVEEATLIRLTATISGDVGPVHATLTTVYGRVFCMSLNRPVSPNGIVTVSNIKQAWRSNFRLDGASEMRSSED